MPEQPEEQASAIKSLEEAQSLQDEETRRLELVADQTASREDEARKQQEERTREEE